MPKKFVHPEGGVGFPKDAADEEALRRIGYVEKGYPKRMYRDSEVREVNGSEEEKALGEGWVVFDEALRKIGGFYREKFIAAVNNPAEQVRLYTEYSTLHLALAAADSWYKKTEPQIPLLQAQAMLDLAAKRQAEDRERRVIKAEETEAAVVTDSAPRTFPAGRPRSKKIVDRDNLIASLRQSKKSFQRIGRNKKIARSLDEQGEKPPDGWGVRTFLEATENPKTSRAFDRMVAKAQFKKVSTP